MKNNPIFKKVSPMLERNIKRKKNKFRQNKLNQSNQKPIYSKTDPNSVKIGSKIGSKFIKLNSQTKLTQRKRKLN